MDRYILKQTTCYAAKLSDDTIDKIIAMAGNNKVMKCTSNVAVVITRRGLELANYGDYISIDENHELTIWDAGIFESRFTLL